MNPAQDKGKMPRDRDGVAVVVDEVQKGRAGSQCFAASSFVRNFLVEGLPTILA